MPLFIVPKSLTLVGQTPPATVETLRRAIDDHDGVASAHLLSTLRSYYTSPALFGDYAARYDRLVAPSTTSGPTEGFGASFLTGPQAHVYQGIRTGLDYAAAAKLPISERQRLLGAYSTAHEVVCQMMLREKHETHQTLTRMKFSHPHSLQKPMLCADGFFYELMMVQDTALARQGHLNCADYPQVTTRQWAQLASMMPLLHAYVGHEQLLGPVGLAWLETGTPYESIVDSDAFSFYAHTRQQSERRGRNFDAGLCPLPIALQVSALMALRRIPKDGWLEFAELLHAGSPALAQMGEEMRATVVYLATECSADSSGRRAASKGNSALPDMPLGVRLGLARVLATTRLREDRKVALIHALQVLCSRTNPVDGIRSLRDFDEVDCSRDVAQLARTLSFTEGNELLKLIDGVEVLSGSTARKSQASFQDVVTMMQVLSLLPRSARNSVVYLARETCYGRHAAYKLWRVMEPLQSCPHTSTAVMLDAAIGRSLESRGTLDGFVRFLRTASALPEHRVKPTSDLLGELIKRSDPDCELAPFIFETLSALSAEEQQAIQTYRQSFEDALMLGSRGGSRAERLLDLERLKRVIGRFAQPVTLNVHHLPPEDEENVMASSRLDGLKSDMIVLQTNYGQVSRSSMGACHQALRTYLQSPTLHDFDLRLRGGSNERANALRALALIEIAPNNQEVDIALLLAMVWTAIEAHAATNDSATKLKEAQNMRYSLAKALAECIEDDSHAVCFWGQGQRLVMPLSGYGFGLSSEADVLRAQPAALLNHLAKEFDAELLRGGFEEPNRAQVERFVRQATATARQRLRGEAELQSFKTNLVQMLNNNEWPNPHI